MASFARSGMPYECASTRIELAQVLFASGRDEEGDKEKRKTRANQVNAQREAGLRALLEAQKMKVLQLKEGRDGINVLQRDVDAGTRERVSSTPTIFVNALREVLGR